MNLFMKRVFCKKKKIVNLSFALFYEMFIKSHLNGQMLTGKPSYVTATQTYANVYVINKYIFAYIKHPYIVVDKRIPACTHTQRPIGVA